MGSPAVHIATSPFGHCGREPLDVLQATGWEIRANPYGRRLRVGEVRDFIGDADGVIAGTEPYSAETLADAHRLRVISRVGEGLDSVDLEYCKERGITVTYTPEAPAQGVAELTIGLILGLVRGVCQSDRSVREMTWNRYMGHLLSELTIGVLGVGRVGSRVIRLLQPFGTTVLGCDLAPNEALSQELGLQWVEADGLFERSELVTIHIPGNRENHHFVDGRRLSLMKPGSYIVNTARGSVLEEEALLRALSERRLAGAALDVYGSEPYEGALRKLDNVLLTAHIGASARASRYRMELEAAEDCVRVLLGEAPRFAAPAERP